MTVSPSLMRTGLGVHQAQLDPDRPRPEPGSEVLLSRPEDSGRLLHGRQKDIKIRGIGSCQVQRNLHSPNSGSWTKASLPQELMKP